MQHSIHHLKNGLRIVLSPLHETKAVTVLVLVKVGSRHETRSINGASHFVEHLMFKGTKKRPNTQVISRELDSIGAEYNAFTGKDLTGYYIKAAADKLELALDMLSDMLFNSKFEEKEINRERGVIVEEINMYEDNPIMYVDNIFEELIYYGSSLGRLISGPRKVIKSVSRASLVKHKDSFYNPANMLVSVAGHISEDKTMRLIKRYFKKPHKNDRLKAYKRFKYQHKRPHAKVMHKETEQAHLALGTPGYQYKDKRLFAAGLLSIIMGGNMSSRLFINIREKQGLCYFIKMTTNTYEDTGNMLIQAGLDKARIEEAITAILAELKRVKDIGVTAEELKRSKEFLKGKIILDLEDSSSVADWFGKQLLFKDKVETPDERFARFAKVTRADVQQVAKHLFRKANLNLAVIGPFKGSKRFVKLLNI
jgi:predicted Zn-dependent peptidase